jgi:hypothetical protein
MASVYDEQIIRLLHEAGEKGMAVRILSKNIFNENNTLFGDLSLEEVYRYVRSYIQRNSKTSLSLIEPTGRRGFYRLNSEQITQLMLNFSASEEKSIDEREIRDEDLSLSLF